MMGYFNTFLIWIFFGGVSSSMLCNAQTNNRDIKTIITMVNTSEDDAEERLNTGRVNLTGSDLELSSDNGKSQIVGLRFNDLDIPQGAKIIAAQLVFKPNESNSIWTSLIICAEDSDHAIPFEETPKNISNRQQTFASVNWSSMAPWSSIANSYTSPDISKVIQEIVDKENWKIANSIALIIDGSGQRTAESFDGNKAGAPTLIIDYIEKGKYYTDNGNILIEAENEKSSSSLSVNNRNEISNSDLKSK